MATKIAGEISGCQSYNRISLRSDIDPASCINLSMAYDSRRARAALAAFQVATGLQDFPWEKASSVGEGTLRRFRSGSSRSMGPITYDKLAAGASGLLGRPVTSAELRGEISLLRRVAVANFVGPGA